jgi:hypothetical protein
VVEWSIHEALVEIATRAPSISGEAYKTLRAPEERVAPRFQRIVGHALSDPQAEWTAEERRALLALVEPLESENRTERAHVRLTEAERAEVEARADGEGVTISEYIRRRIVAG